MQAKSTREQIILAADKLFYQQGYERTSFTEIAQRVNISRGNFYYHFRTKDEILDAVVNKRLQDTQLMLNRWELEGSTPAQRIQSFINILLVNQNKIRKFGCPVGTLCSELAKMNHGLQKDAKNIFTLFRVWLARQFTLMGHKQQADQLALHLLSRSQGVATLYNAYRDDKFLSREVKSMSVWLKQYEK